MLARVYSSSVFGIDSFQVAVEVSLKKGLRKIVLVGLPDAAIKESKQRVIAAIMNAGHFLPRRTIIVNLAPAEIKKQGAGFDLPIAVGILASGGAIPEKQLKEYLIVGELSLDNSVRAVRGILSIAADAKKMGLRKIILPAENAKEASFVDDVEIYPVSTLKQTINFLRGIEKIPIYPGSLYNCSNKANINSFDFSDTKGQQYSKRALEIAAAGHHNVLLIGPPGSGKTMLAKRLPTIMPSLTLKEALETTKIHSIAGVHYQDGLVNQRPFRAPHHTISYAGLAGGGSIPRPGEISLAHNGVLFLDELPEFRRNVLEILRQPLEEGFVCISRASASIVYPAKFMLISAMNPCPCGFYTDHHRMCKCTPAEIKRYLSKISGPLLDRIDMNIFLHSVPTEELLRKCSESESSAIIKTRVISARTVQHDRFRKEGILTNSEMTRKHLELYCPLSQSCQQLIHAAMKSMGITARAFDRILKVARTISDLNMSNNIEECHLAEAIQYHNFDRFAAL